MWAPTCLIRDLTGHDCQGDPTCVQRAYPLCRPRGGQSCHLCPPLTLPEAAAFQQSWGIQCGFLSKTPTLVSGDPAHKTPIPMPGPPTISLSGHQ